jgi:hypothetical protein
MMANLQVDDSLVSPIFPAKPCTVQGVLDIRQKCTGDPLLFRYSMLDSGKNFSSMLTNDG